jgi:hypothetical protein
MRRSISTWLPFVKSLDRLTSPAIKNTMKQKELFDRWKQLVNMTDLELRLFLATDEGKQAGLTRSEASRQGIRSGQDSAQALLRMIPLADDYQEASQNWNRADWEWAKRQVSFISRMRGNKGPLLDRKGRKTRKHTSLLLWGHNPESTESVGTLPGTSFEWRLRQLMT